MRVFFKMLFSVALSVVLGCSSAKPPTCNLPQQTGLVIDGSDRLNPDESGRSLPTIIRIYQLKEISKLEMATFEEIWQKADETLGDTVLAKDELTPYPGRRVVRGFERNPEANYIAAVAIVRRPSGVTWRTIFELPASAAETQCAAQQQDPATPPPAPQAVRISLRVEDYRIEGEMTLVSSGGCTGSALECLVQDAQGVAQDAQGAAQEGQGAAQEAQGAAQQAQGVQAPAVPQAPPAAAP